MLLYITYQFLYASVLTNLLPGSDRIFVVAATLRTEMRGGVLGALGITTGIFIHSLIGALGLAVLTQTYPFLFNAIRVVGIAVLFGLGLRYWLSFNIPNPTWAGLTKKFSTFWQGLFVHLFNPIAIVFSFTFIPQFIDPTGNFAKQFLVLSAMSNAISLIVNLVVAFLITHLQRKLRMPERSLRLFSGLILIGIAVKISFDWWLQ